MERYFSWTSCSATGLRSMERRSRKSKPRRRGRIQPEAVLLQTSKSRCLRSFAICLQTICIRDTDSRTSGSSSCINAVPVQLKPLQVQAAQALTSEDQTWRCLYLSLIEGGYHSWWHMDPCTTRSDDCTSSFGGQPVGSPDTTGGSSNLGTSAECIRNCFCQWSTATSANLNSTYDHAIGVSFCCAPHCRIFIIYISTYFECHNLKLNLNLRNSRFNSVQTNFCFYRTIEYGNKLNLSYVSINGIGSFIAT